MNAITSHHLTVAKGKTSILNGLDIAVKAGSLTGLIGPSGSGKTTLMRTIVGVQKYRGGLEVLGQPAGSASLRPRIGYVTQSPAVYGDLTVAQNIAYFARTIGVSPQAAAKVIEDVQLTPYASRITNDLSGGQRARVSLAVALLGDPDVLVLDEPTVGLDPLLRDDLWRQFEQLAARGKTVLVSSHSMDEAERCDDVLLVRDGHVLWNDSRKKLLAHTHTTTVNNAFIAMVKEVA